MDYGPVAEGFLGRILTRPGSVRRGGQKAEKSLRRGPWRLANGAAGGNPAMLWQLVPFQLNASMHYTYVLQSAKDGRWYTGATQDLRARVEDHLKGRVESTRSRRPLRLIY